ncbi:hypothetical protein [Maricaulis sp.]|uniref:hypothetical protein n=1 Tax=Maricaulis sp. TaxID=1486257 RepID=UPI003299EE37
MIRKTLVAAGAILVAGGGTAIAWTVGDYNPYYEYTYFSDASKTEVVGWMDETCVNNQILPGQAVGTQTPYWHRSLLGNCGPGGHPV